jgi:hypothetical protein
MDQMTWCGNLLEAREVRLRVVNGTTESKHNVFSVSTVKVLR